MRLANLKTERPFLVGFDCIYISNPLSQLHLVASRGLPWLGSVLGKPLA